ncbi:MAG: family glycosyltransferase, 4-amino-4-deoxy-L-arabinose transferase [Bryobacterales bacterium]|nr:family glycosyltransferase, 4-amino-4-deoxy-L-arabinose transferase [Bryobacterales bacterium]
MYDHAARKRPRVVLGLWACALLLIAALSAYASARFRPLWHDEIYTAALAHQGSPARIWDALARAADANPPPYYVLAATLSSLPVNEELSLRLPSLVGFLVFLGSVAFFVWRAFGPLSCLVASAVLVSSETLYYGSEARPYGALLGAFGLAAILWQHRRRGGEPRRATLVFLILCLSIPCSLHYYGALGVMMFGLTEVAAGIRTRKPDWRFLLALPLTLIPVLLALPLIKAAHGQFGGAFWARASLKSIAAGYLFTFSLPQFGAIGLARLPSGREITLADMFLPAVLMLAACGLIWRQRRTPERLTWPQPELLLASALLLLPFVTGLVGIVSTGIFAPRYALASTIGAAVFSGWLLPAWNRKAAYGLAAVLTLALIGNEVPRAVHRLSALASGETPRRSVNQRLAPLYRRMDSGASAVIADGLVYLETFHYASPKYRSSLLYLEDRQSAKRISGNDTLDGGLLNLQPYVGFHLELASDFLAANREFLMLSTGQPLEWLPKYLRQGNAQINTIETIGTLTLSSVRLP